MKARVEITAADAICLELLVEEGVLSKELCINIITILIHLTYFH